MSFFGVAVASLMIVRILFISWCTCIHKKNFCCCSVESWAVKAGEPTDK